MKSVQLLVRRIVSFFGNAGFAQRASFSSVEECDRKQEVMVAYQKLRQASKDFTPACKINPHGVFALNKTDLGGINIFGFDYDYTLAEYSDHMQEFIYRKSVEILHKKYKYPREILDEEYEHDFCIRGLHYDIKRGLLMKIDGRHIVQIDTVRRGRRTLNAEEVEELELEFSHIPKKVMDDSCFRGRGNLQQLTDIFSLPEALLLANVTHYFTENSISYDPYSVFEAVERAVREVHTDGHLYSEIAKNVDKYLRKDALKRLIEKLRNDGKTLFLLTNSKYPCVDVGMSHMLGKNWRDSFEIVMVEAKKPHFFDKTDRPFKTLLLDDSSGNGAPVSWANIKELKKGQVYREGCCSELMRLMKWAPRKVIYFGDQIYADLQSPSQSNGWYTCAVIHELKREIEVMNEKPFARAVVWVQALERLIERMQEFRDPDSCKTVEVWLKERDTEKAHLKTVFNEKFGSIFRSSLQGSYFFSRLSRVADIYTSSVNNLLDEPENKIFFPPRGSHPHESLIETGYLHDGFDSAFLAMSNRNDYEARKAMTLSLEH